MTFHFTYLWECLYSGIQYFPNTLKLTLFPIIFGLIFGTMVAATQVYNVPILGKGFQLFVMVYRGIPIVVALMIYNLIFVLKFSDIANKLHLGIEVRNISNIVVGIFALSVMAVCSMSESVKGAFISVEKSQFEAGYSIGHTKIQTLVRIIIPQMIPVAIPMLTNNIVGLIKGSSVAMAIGIAEVLAGSVVPCSKTYRFFEGYIAAAIIYWTFTVAIEKTAGCLEKHIGRRRRRPI